MVVNQPTPLPSVHFANLVVIQSYSITTRVTPPALIDSTTITYSYPLQPPSPTVVTKAQQLFSRQKQPMRGQKCSNKLDPKPTVIHVKNKYYMTISFVNVPHMEKWDDKLNKMVSY